MVAVAVVSAAVVSMVRPAAAQEWVTFRGYVETDNRMTIEGESEFTFNENTFGMTVEAFPSDEVRLLGSFQIDALNTQERTDEEGSITIDEQQRRDSTDPVRLELDEAYMMVTGLGLPDLDVKIGKQRIQWGTADQFNPTDNLNPDDFHDPLLFGKKTPTPAIQAQYYLGDFTFTAVYLPQFYPSLLPEQDLRPIYEKNYEELAGEFHINTGSDRLDVLFKGLMLKAIQQAELGDVAVRAKLPQNGPSSAGAGGKIATNVAGVDVSTSYAYVYDDFGVPRRVNLTVDPLSTGFQFIDSVDLEINNEFYRMHVIGGDFAMNVPGLDTGLWGEGAYFIPADRFDTDYFLDMGPDVNDILGSIAHRDISDGVVISQDHPLDDNYFKCTIGTDYTFPGAWFINAQYIRGLPTDNTAETVSDYIFAGVDKPFVHDQIKVRFFAGYSFVDDSYELLPTVYFFPVDAIELQMGALLVGGDLDTKFGAFGDDIGFFRAKAFF